MRLGTGFLFGFGLQFFLAVVFAVLKNRFFTLVHSVASPACFSLAVVFTVLNNRFLPKYACFSLPGCFYRAE